VVGGVFSIDLVSGRDYNATDSPAPKNSVLYAKLLCGCGARMGSNDEAFFMNPNLERVK
jgi:hypothetical protein